MLKKYRPALHTNISMTTVSKPFMIFLSDTDMGVVIVTSIHPAIPRLVLLSGALLLWLLAGLLIYIALMWLFIHSLTHSLTH